MRYDATYGRDHRWIEGHVALCTPCVVSGAGVEQAMRFALSKEAFSNV
jgi:hypothetical protein